MADLNEHSSEANSDIALELEAGRFRYRAACVIIENGKILLAKNNRDDYYYSVGGAVKIDETAEEACERECFEETGVHFEIDRLLFIHENFFPSTLGEGKVFHELAFYFLMKPHEHSAFKTEKRGDWQESMEWLPIADFANYRAYPPFFAEELPKFLENPADFKLKRIVAREC